MADDEASNSANPAPTSSNAVDDTTMDDILEKLRLLRYDVEFCPTAKPPFRPLNRSSFAVAESNANAQFYYFTSLVAWLLRLCGASGFAAPGQFDDPNASAVNILTELRGMNFPVRDIAPNRLRTGSGEPVLAVLQMLTDRALVAKGFAFKSIVYPPSDKVDDKADEGAGGVDEGIDDRVVLDSDDEEEDYHAGTKKTGKADEPSIKPQVTAEAWNLEVERVAPLLQIRSDDMKDWRSRIEGSTTLLKAVEKMYPDIKTMLVRMGDDLDKSRDRIVKREQTLSQQFAGQVEEYRTKLRELNTAQEGVTQASQTVSQLSNELNQVTELLDQTKQEIEERESKISDTSPLMQIKDAVTKVRSEIKQMSLRIGILQHTVLHYRLRQLKAKRDGRASLIDDEEESLIR